MNTFFSYLVELFFYSNNISADLQSSNTYASSLVSIVVISIGVCFVYYLFFDTARYSGIKAWFLTALITFFITVVVNFSIVSSVFVDLEQFYMQDYMLYALVCGLYAFLFYFLISIIFKRFAKSLSRTPL